MSPSFIVFSFLYLLSFVFVVEMDDWFLIWFGLEMNMMSFLLLIYERMSLFNVECCMKYFFVQSLGSVVFIGSYFLSSESLGEVGPLILSYKMGGGPFYFWFPSVCGGISWGSCFLLMSFQKFIPMILMTKMIGWSLWLVIVISLVVGIYGSFNQNNVKLMMAFSSIHQIGWLLMCVYIGEIVWFVYFFMYSIVLGVIVLVFKLYFVENFLSVGDVKSKLWVILMMMNLGGVPPLLGFFLKWFSLYNFVSVHYFLLVFMVFMSVIMLYVYMRVCYDLLLGGEMKMGWFDYEEVVEIKMMADFKLEVMVMMGVVLGGFLLLLFV